MTDKLFTQETPEQDPANQDPSGEQDTPTEQPKLDPSTPLFKVGDRDYDAEQAMKKIQHSEAFIDQLLKEKREIEEKFKRMEGQAKEAEKLDARLQEALDQLSGQQIRNDDPSQETETVDYEKLQEQLRKIAEETAANTYENQTKAQREQENLNKSIQAVKEMYGESYQEKLLDKAKALGLTQEQAEDMAKSNPLLFTETFARKPQSSPQPQEGRRSPYASRKEEFKLPRVTGYWDANTKVAKLREAEAQLTKAIQDGTYKPRSR